MKDSYEMGRFLKHYILLNAVFLPIVWAVSWYCCEFEVMKAFVVSGLFLTFSVCICVFSYNEQRKIYEELENVSGLMVNVLEGNVNDKAEVYKEGTLGILYTNFYKMVTMLKESQEKEGREKEFLRDTISDISHQLKTPLASLGVFVDLLYDDKIADKGKQKEMLEEARKQLDRMEWMVLAMLKLARIEVGSVQFVKRLCNVENIIETAVEGINYLIEKRKQKIVVDLQKGHACEKEIMIICDGEWLTEAVINLLKNASDYSGEQTTIMIRAEENELFTRIHIQDEGMGVPEKELPHIFKRFYRVNHSVNAGSVGIGLALTKSIIEGMGGKIKVKSEIDRYTRFTLTFMK